MGFSKLIERTGALKRFAAFSFTNIYGVGRKKVARRITVWWFVYSAPSKGIPIIIKRWFTFYF